jgi:G protein-coupled receptor kinase interacting protein 2
MVQSLYSCGANSIWEYSLLNPTSSKAGKRKPGPTDPLHPNKADFIRAKHQLLSYVFKPAKDDLLVTESDLSKQLHSSVRTPNLETSLRLLSQGADPNYFHPEKNSTPLSVAGRAGQACQVELLLVYGADPAAGDLSGKTASEHARTAGHLELATRLTTAQYELSDRLSLFLGGRRPDHQAGRHYVIPEGGPGPGDSKVARRKMTGLSNKVFEELAVDVYDEVDRRETDALWSRTEVRSQNTVPVPFLPVNPDYSATRNQGRQKLARLTQAEFASLVLDVLKEIRRRQQEIDTARGVLPEVAGAMGRLGVSRAPGRPGDLSDDEPLYDSVASDDDYYTIQVLHSK